MDDRKIHNKLSIDNALFAFVEQELLVNSGIQADNFWDSFEKILEEFIPRNQVLLETRDHLQQQIDAWHIAHRDKPHNQEEYRQFLKEIGYLLDEGPDFTINTEHVDPEIASIAGPQLVVPINNARFALNATNARWGSLFDAFYGTDMIPDSGEYAKGKAFNPKRGQKVIEMAMDFLDLALPLTEGKHSTVSAYTMVDTIKDGKSIKQLQVYLNNGHIAELKYPAAFKGYSEKNSSCALLFKNNGLYFELLIDPLSPIGKTSLTGIKDIIMEAAITTIQDCEDSVTAVDTEDKIQVYRNWLGLMKGDLKETITKNGQTLTRQLNPDREYCTPDHEPFSLSGRSLMLVRNVGHLMTIDSVLYDDQPVPEGILDGIMTTLGFLQDYHNQGIYKNSKTNSLYIVKPKMHGPEEVRFSVDLFAAIEKAFNLPVNTLKIGIMDEERRTTVNLKACIREAKDRLIFINTGFLDRTGDEIHTSLEAGPFLSKKGLKNAPWIAAYEQSNVDIGLACGLPGKAQIGKGMWAMPDRMADMVKTKIEHPLAGANCAWVPSPTAATLHAMHYHQVNVRQVQEKLANRQRASLNDILTIPLMPEEYLQQSGAIQDCIENNAQSILGYVVRWVDQGIGCSKVPDTQHIGLMEDRATLRISSQLLANWLHHDLCTEAQIIAAFKKMALLVDQQNSHDPFYTPMAPDYNGIAFQAALDLVLKGRVQPNGYTEPLLHYYRLKKKHQ